MKHERRTFHNVEVRESSEKGPNGRPVLMLRAITPNVVDDYGSRWLPGVFDKAIESRMAANERDTPALCWAHDWSDPIGHGVSYERSAEGPMIGFELDDFDAVPRARQAHAQIKSGTIRDCSVGFFAAKRREPTDAERRDSPGIVEVIEEADLDEVSLVLRGAVPGAKVISMRGAPVAVDAVVDLARRQMAGEITKEEAQVALDLLAGPREPDAGVPAIVDPPAPDPDDDGTDAALDAALDIALGRTARHL